MACPPLRRGTCCTSGPGARNAPAEALSLRDADRRADLPAGGVAFVRQDIAVPVAMVHGDPPVRDRAVDAALEVAVANVEEVDAPQRAACLHLVADENAEDLAAGFVVGERVSHGDTGSTKSVTDQKETLELRHSRAAATMRSVAHELI